MLFDHFLSLLWHLAVMHIIWCPVSSELTEAKSIIIFGDLYSTSFAWSDHIGLCFVRLSCRLQQVSQLYSSQNEQNTSFFKWNGSSTFCSNKEPSLRCEPFITLSQWHRPRKSKCSLHGRTFSVKMLYVGFWASFFVGTIFKLNNQINVSHSAARIHSVCV